LQGGERPGCRPIALPIRHPPKLPQDAFLLRRTIRERRPAAERWPGVVGRCDHRRIGRLFADRVELLFERVGEVHVLAANDADLFRRFGCERLGAVCGFPAAFGVADVADRSALMAAVDTAERAFGPVAGLFANAGSGGRFAPLCEYDNELFDAVLRTNLTSIYWAIKRVLPAMRARRSGSIVVTGSLASERGMPHNVAYVASKHAVLGLARAAAVGPGTPEVRRSRRPRAGRPSRSRRRTAAELAHGRTDCASDSAGRLRPGRGRPMLT